MCVHASSVAVRRWQVTSTGRTILTGETRSIRGNPVPLCPPEMPHGLNLSLRFHRQQEIMPRKIMTFSLWPTAPSGQSFLIVKVSRLHSGTPQSVGLLRASDRTVAETSTWLHTTFARDNHDLGGIRTRNPSKRAAVDPCLKPRDHWDYYEVLLWQIWVL
jgi:hypothetical protein